MVVNLSPFFSGIDHLPKLRKLVASMVVPFVVPGQYPTPSSSSLSPFIMRHQETLEHLTIRFYHPRSQPFVEEKWMQMGSPRFYFPRLRTFELGVLSSRYIAQEKEWRDNILCFPSVPRLEKLSIIDKALSWNDVNALLSVLTRPGMGDQLRRMSLKVEQLTPRLVDLLAAKLPHLKELDLAFIEYGSEMPSDYQNWRWNHSEASFRDEMQARRYPHWKVQYLRLSTLPISQHSQCCYGHADVCSMEIIARCLPSRPTFGLRNDYGCCC